MSQDRGYSGAHLMLAFLAGAVGGACVALLSSPRSGQQIRQSLRGWAHETQGKAVRVPEALRSAYGRASVAARDAFSEALRDEESRPETPADT